MLKDGADSFQCETPLWVTLYEILSFHFCAVVVSLNSPLPSLSLEAKDAGNIFCFVPRYDFFIYQSSQLP